jgi:3(or 17)beta-hydroxysteroid dehydrogenase
MARVNGKVALITGGASGIGAADARLLVAEGARVVIADLNENLGQALADELGDAAVFIKLDVASEESWQAALAFTEETFGALHVLVNNAGILKTGSPVDTTLEDWQLLMRVNGDGVFLGCKYALPLIERSGGGSIINMSSLAAVEGVHVFTAYCATKGAVRSLTKAVAVYCREQGNNVRCNSIHPDGVKTPMVGKLATGKEEMNKDELEELLGASPRMCEPEDVANTVLFLASDDSRYINGAEIMVDNAATVTPIPV